MRFLVKTGERIPADGVVERGESHVDESVLTGESVPRARRPGDVVIGGSLNTTGVLEIAATRTGEDSTLRHMIRAVEAAMSSRSDVERNVDRASRYFIPAVMAVALLTLVGGLALGAGTGTALMRAIAVLVIACPCALGIATPLAVTAAVGACSRKGVLVSDSRVLELAGRVNIALFDKTGTVTAGSFTVREVISEDPKALALVAAIEQYSEHPLGRAVVEYARANGLPIPEATDVQIHKGSGITGQVAGRAIFAGSHRMAKTPDDALAARAAEWESRGLTTAFFGQDGRVQGALALGDTLRPRAAETIQQLRSRGVRTALISGDSRTTTAWAAAELHVDEFRAEVLPLEKLEMIREYQAKGNVVAMIGDGVNDAPALAAANLGIALGSGTDLAMQAAPVVLMSADLDRVALVFTAAQDTMRVVRQNLFWAFFYNAGGITLAATGILNPILAAGAMVLSSLCVIGNSMRLSSRIGRTSA